eukprot:4812056-Amphidinium_carterae.1
MAQIIISQRIMTQNHNLSYDPICDPRYDLKLGRSNMSGGRPYTAGLPAEESYGSKERLECRPRRNALPKGFKLLQNRSEKQR